jgi:hypothetical protein
MRDPDYVHLERIRNKLLTHWLENVLTTDRHDCWGLKNYDSTQKMFDLISRVISKINVRIDGLIQQGKLHDRPVNDVRTPEIVIQQSDIEELVDALKQQNIY